MSADSCVVTGQPQIFCTDTSSTQIPNEKFVQKKFQVQFPIICLVSLFRAVELNSSMPADYFECDFHYEKLLV